MALVDITDKISKAIDAYADGVEQEMKNQIHVDTGVLRDSIKNEKKSEDKRVVRIDGAKVASDPRNKTKMDYSWYYYKGHGAYTVVPKRAKALRWIGKDGEVHFAKKVRIPASSGDDFIGRTLDNLPKLKI